MSKTRYDKWMQSPEAKVFYASHPDDEIQSTLMRRANEAERKKPATGSRGKGVKLNHYAESVSIAHATSGMP